MSHTRFAWALAWGVLFGPAAGVQAAAIDPSRFSDDAVEVSFASLPVDFGRPGPLLMEGVTFASGSGILRTYGALPAPDVNERDVCGVHGCIMNDADLDFLSVTLADPVAVAGAWVGITNVATTARADFFSGDLWLGSVDVAARPFEGVFAGWDAGGDRITRVTFTDTDGQGFVLGLSGFTYQMAPPVAEPSTLALLAAGTLTLAVARRRRP